MPPSSGLDLNLQPLQRRVDIAHRAAAAPSSPSTCQGSSACAAHSTPSANRRPREAELEVRREPLGVEGDSRAAADPSSTSSKSCSTKCGSMKRSWSSVPQRDQRVPCTALPEARDQRAQQQLLREAHARMRRHLEGAQLQQAKPAGLAVGRVELVDAELGAVGVAGDVDQQVAHDAVHQPGGMSAPRLPRFPKRDLQLVDAGRCAPRRRAAPGWSGRRTGPRTGRTATDGCASTDQAAQQVGPAQERAVAGVAPPSTK